MATAKKTTETMTGDSAEKDTDFVSEAGKAHLAKKVEEAAKAQAMVDKIDKPAGTLSRPSSPQVYQSLCAITAGLAKDGIEKGQRNRDQNYSFRGIDDVYHALSPLLVKERVVIAPIKVKRLVERYENKKGTMVRRTDLIVTYAVVSAVDGSSITVEAPGEGLDFSDKATNKAMSAAYKYLVLQLFCVPTEGVNIDGDAETITVEQEPVQDTRQTKGAPAIAVDKRSDADGYISLCEKYVADFDGSDQELRQWWKAETDHRTKYNLSVKEVDYVKTLCAKRLAEMAEAEKGEAEDPFA